MQSLSPLVFFGTPDFAVPTLAALAAAGMAPALVVTQPARPVGRGGRLTEPPVAAWAHEHGLPVAQPAKVKDEAFLERLAGLSPVVGVVVAFGQIFPRRLLDLPRLGCVNLHASLLPRYRGAAPIQAAIAAGERETGIATMQMDLALDAGPVLLERRTPIGVEETAGELSTRLAELGAGLMVETLKGLAAGTIEPRAQDDSQATFAPRIDKALGRADFAWTAAELFDRLRAYTPWPGLTAELSGAPVKLVWGRPAPDRAAGGEPAGTVLGLDAGRLLVACGGGSVFGLERLQRSGRGVVSAADFANGERLAAGARFQALR